MFYYLLIAFSTFYSLAQFVKLVIAIAIFLTFSLQFYVPMEIIWKSVKGKFNTHKEAAEYSIRIGLVVCQFHQSYPTFTFCKPYCIVTIWNSFLFQILTVVIAAAIPNLGPFISLIGAVCLSTLGLIFPSVIEIVTFWEKPGMGQYNWRLWKNVALIMFGIIGFLTGTYVSVLEILEEHR